MKALIKDIWEGSYKPYGRPKIAGELARKGHRYSLPYVARLMKQMGIRSRAKQRFVATTDPRHEHPVCENLLDRKFAVDEQEGQLPMCRTTGTTRGVPRGGGILLQVDQVRARLPA